MAIVQNLITLFIFLLPFGVVLRIETLPNVFVYPSDIVAGLVLFFTLYKIITIKKIPHEELFYPLVLFVLIGFISLLINSRFLNLNSFLV